MRDEVTMTDRKPYLLRAIYQWIVDNDCTPHLVIAAPGAGWVHGVPLHLLQEEMLVLNISPTATVNLSIDNDSVTFNTRFGGQPHQVWVSMQAIVSLIARETGEGINLPPAEGLEEGPQDSDVTPSAPDGEDKPSGSHLKILK